MTSPHEHTVGLLLSGGLDSSILLGHLLDGNHRVRPFYIRAHLFWETQELRAVNRFIEALASPKIDELVVLDLPLADLYGSHWSVTGHAVPDAETSDDAVYLPGRNALLIIKAAIWCRLHGIGELALAPLGSNPFADATDEFFAEFESALNRATTGNLRIIRPFGRLHKRDVMEFGRRLPLEITFSCIAPQGGMHCGVCNKCAERRLAFREAEIQDRTPYAPTHA